jgi:hypothetical protein
VKNGCLNITRFSKTESRSKTKVVHWILLIKGIMLSKTVPSSNIWTDLVFKKYPNGIRFKSNCLILLELLALMYNVQKNCFRTYRTWENLYNL